MDWESYNCVWRKSSKHVHEHIEVFLFLLMFISSLFHTLIGKIQYNINQAESYKHIFGVYEFLNSKDAVSTNVLTSVWMLDESESGVKVLKEVK